MGASWNASYDARVMEASQVVELTYYGNIKNSTLEDWVEVRTFFILLEFRTSGFTNSEFPDSFLFPKYKALVF
jgi:hypothetical protein